MDQTGYRIPEKISQDEQSYLNCKSGSDEKPDTEADRFTLNRFEITFTDRYLQLYYNYPDKGSSDSDYIDIVALSPVFGCVCVNISSLEISEIEEIRGPDWSIKGQPNSIRPVTTAGNSEVAIRRLFEEKPELRNASNRSVIPTNGYLVLPNITKAEWESKFEESDSNILFKDILESRESLRSNIEINTDLTEIDIRNALAALRFSDVISGGQLNVTTDLETKREYIDFINRRLKILTDKQIKIGLQTPDAPQRIRGIAGSGKTVVMALKAAKLHKENPDFDIALTFRNHGLRQTHRELVTGFYETMTDGDEPNWEKLNILHGWGGGFTGPGMYSTIASAVAEDLGHSPYSSKDAQRKFGKYTTINERLNLCCKEVCQLDSLPTIFNAILIDEAQDLPEYFYRMCWLVCDSNKRVYWAYDEAQNLSTLEAKTTEELFGTDAQGQARVDISEFLDYSVEPSHKMRKAFRTPRSVLMTAHGFGMGLYRDGPVIQTITNEEGWDAIGYKIDDDCSFESPGNTIVARRPIENSPHPLWEHQEPNELVDIHWADTWEDEISWVANDIQKLLVEEGVLPEEIMVTHLWPFKQRDERLDKLEGVLQEKCGSVVDDDSVVHRVGEAVDKKGSDADFRVPGKITVSGVYYARGNEAEVVYVMGIDYAGERASREQFSEDTWRRKHVEARNRAFVLLTRSQGWCKITGTDPTHRIAGELNRVKNDTISQNPKLEFSVPPRDSPFKNLEPEGL